MYLRTRAVKWDTLAVSSIEVGLTLGLLNLTLGMVWARPIWNTWWTWDPRLTSAAIMILTYSAYLMLRNSIENDEQRRRFAAVYGILAITTAIITLVITRIRPDTIHPVVIGNAAQNAQGTFAMTKDMTMALGINSAIWSILVPWVLIWYRIRLENLAQKVQSVRATLMEK
jgi:heme exporter protein C